MKRPYLKSNCFIFRTCLVVLAVGIGVIIHGCQKENKQPLDPQEFNTLNNNIPALKDIYSKAIAGSMLKTFSTNISGPKLIRSRDVDWGTYTLQRRSDSAIIAEFDIKNDTGLYTLKKLSVGDTVKYANRTTVTFIKFKNGKD
jgi:hypothetical protein